MSDNGILSWFEKINIDDYTLEQLLQYNLKEVPGILVIGNNGQRAMHEGPKAFEWLDNMIHNSRRISDMVDHNRKKILEKNRMVNNGDNSVVDYSKNEMAGKSDEYAYLATDMYQAKSYVDYAKGDQPIVTLRERDTVSKGETTNMLKQAEQSRDAQTEQIKQNMRQGQVEAVYNHRMIRR